MAKKKIIRRVGKSVNLLFLTDLKNEGKSNAECSEILGVSVNIIKNRVKRLVEDGRLILRETAKMEKNRRSASQTLGKDIKPVKCLQCGKLFIPYPFKNCCSLICSQRFYNQK